LAVGLCGYDNKGNLYLWVYNAKKYQIEFARLVESSGSFKVLSLNTEIYTGDGFYPSVQWDGKHMTISSYPFGRPLIVYQLQIAGSKATVLGATMLQSERNQHNGQSWIAGRQILGITTLHSAEHIDFWAYPAGGRPEKEIKVSEFQTEGYLQGIVMSPGSSSH
jgi:hypothetical protein